MANECRMVKFFGGFPLSVGALVALAYHVLWGACLVYWASLCLTLSVLWEHDVKEKKLFMLVDDASIYGGMYAVVAVFAIISTVVFTIGISTDNSIVVLIWVIFDVIQIVVTSAVNIVVVYMTRDQFTALFLGLVIIKIYFWFVSLSFYYELRVLYTPRQTGHSQLE